MRLLKGLVAAAIAASLLMLPAGALAKGRDRDHDRMPDKWEKKHHLNPRVNDARKDPDHDGLANLSEFRHHTDPQKADTDDDGINDENEIEDGANPNSDDNEISGTVAAFDNNVLTIQLSGDGAGSVSGTVNDSTVVKCDDDAGGDNRGDSSGPGSGDDGGSGDNRDDTEHQCTSADLKPQARVHEAKFVKAADGTLVFTKIELVPAT